MPTKESENPTVETQPEIQPPSEPVKAKSGNSKKLLLILGIVLIICVCIACSIVTVLFLLGSASVSTADYIQKTEMNYNKNSASVYDLQLSIEEDFGGQTEGVALIEYENKLNQAALIAKSLDENIPTYQSAIPNTNSDTKNLDALLKDYYSSAKDLASSYKSLIKVYTDFMPLNNDFDKASKDLTDMISDGEPTTGADYNALTVNINQVVSNLKKDQPILSNISTTSETAYLKADTGKLLDATIKYLEAFAVFTGEMETLVDSTDTEAIDAITETFITAQTDFQTISAESTNNSKAQKEALILKYKDMASQLIEKIDLVDAEYIRLKALTK